MVLNRLSRDSESRVQDFVFSVDELNKVFVEKVSDALKTDWQVAAEKLDRDSLYDALSGTMPLASIPDPKKRNLAKQFRAALFARPLSVAQKTRFVIKLARLESRNKLACDTVDKYRRMFIGDENELRKIVRAADAKLAALTSLLPASGDDLENSLTRVQENAAKLLSQIAQARKEKSPSPLDSLLDRIEIDVKSASKNIQSLRAEYEAIDTEAPWKECAEEWRDLGKCLHNLDNYLRDKSVAFKVFQVRQQTESDANLHNQVVSQQLVEKAEKSARQAKKQACQTAAAVQTAKKKVEERLAALDEAVQDWEAGRLKQRQRLVQAETARQQLTESLSNIKAKVRRIDSLKQKCQTSCQTLREALGIDTSEQLLSVEAQSLQKMDMLATELSSTEDTVSNIEQALAEAYAEQRKMFNQYEQSRTELKKAEKIHSEAVQTQKRLQTHLEKTVAAANVSVCNNFAEEVIAEIEKRLANSDIA